MSAPEPMEVDGPSRPEEDSEAPLSLLNVVTAGLERGLQENVEVDDEEKKELVVALATAIARTAALRGIDLGATAATAGGTLLPIDETVLELFAAKEHSDLGEDASVGAVFEQLVEISESVAMELRARVPESAELVERMMRALNRSMAAVARAGLARENHDPEPNPRTGPPPAGPPPVLPQQPNQAQPGQGQQLSSIRQLLQPSHPPPAPRQPPQGPNNRHQPPGHPYPPPRTLRRPRQSGQPGPFPAQLNAGMNVPSAAQHPLQLPQTHAGPASTAAPGLFRQAANRALLNLFPGPVPAEQAAPAALSAAGGSAAATRSPSLPRAPPPTPLINMQLPNNNLNDPNNMNSPNPPVLSRNPNLSRLTLAQARHFYTLVSAALNEQADDTDPDTAIVTAFALAQQQARHNLGQGTLPIAGWNTAAVVQGSAAAPLPAGMAGAMNGVYQSLGMGAVRGYYVAGGDVQRAGPGGGGGMNGVLNAHQNGHQNGGPNGVVNGIW